MEQLIQQIRRNPPSCGTVVVLKSTVAGQHIFKKKPIAGMLFPLKMTREKNNRFHANAFIIESGAASSYKEEIRARGEEQKLFGEQFGHCRVLSPTFWRRCSKVVTLSRAESSARASGSATGM